MISAPCSLFKRLDEKIAAAAMGSDARAALRRFARRLRSVSEEMRAHAATLEAFEGTPGEEWEALAVKRRRDLTAEFFEHLQTLAAAAGDNTARREGARRLISKSLECVTPQYTSTCTGGLQLPATTWRHEVCCWTMQLSGIYGLHASCCICAWVCHAKQEARSHVLLCAHARTSIVDSWHAAELAATGARLAALAVATDRAAEDQAAQEAAAQELQSLFQARTAWMR